MGMNITLDIAFVCLLGLSCFFFLSDFVGWLVGFKLILFSVYSCYFA